MVPANKGRFIKPAQSTRIALSLTQTPNIRSIKIFAESSLIGTQKGLDEFAVAAHGHFGKSLQPFPFGRLRFGLRPLKEQFQSPHEPSNVRNKMPTATIYSRGAVVLLPFPGIWKYREFFRLLIRLLIVAKPHRTFRIHIHTGKLIARL